MAPPAVLQHPRDLVFHGEPHAFDIDVHDRVIVGFGLLDQRRDVAFDAGIVEGQIEPAICLHRMIDQRLNLGCDQHICPLEAGRPTGITDHRDCLLAALNIAITDDDLRPFARKRERCRAADSRTSTSYQCDLSFQFFHDVDLLDRRPRLTTQIWRIFLPSKFLLSPLYSLAARQRRERQRTFVAGPEPQTDC